jgi:riboflavin transporter FmnP
MSPFEYLLLFAAIILGLAIADLAMSIHRLLAAGARVSWDWLAPLAAFVVFLKIVTQWWTWYGASRIASGLTFEMFLAVLVASILLFLLTAVSLPDDFGERSIDLRDYYASVSRRFWLTEI